MGLRTWWLLLRLKGSAGHGGKVCLVVVIAAEEKIGRNEVTERTKD